MDAPRIAGLLTKYLLVPLSQGQLEQLSVYLELLLRWNRRFNLTAVRDPETVVTRHFGESLFAAAHLLGGEAAAGGQIDVGSGAGFPGLVMSIYSPTLPLTVVEAQLKKATFLREVVRTLGLPQVTVRAERAEQCPVRAPLVTLRAVEQFERIVPVAASLLSPGAAPAAAPRLALLIGLSQAAEAARLLPRFSWQEPTPIPRSSARVLLVGSPRPHSE